MMGRGLSRLICFVRWFWKKKPLKVKNQVFLYTIQRYKTIYLATETIHEFVLKHDVQYPLQIQHKTFIWMPTKQKYTQILKNYFQLRIFYEA